MSLSVGHSICPKRVVYYFFFLEYKAAAFNGHSYVRLKKLRAYYRFSLEMEFKSFADDGILLYDQQQADGSGDFISIAIVNKWVASPVPNPQI